LPSWLSSLSVLINARNTAMSPVSTEDQLDVIKGTLFYFDNSFGKQGFFKLESHFPEECIAKTLLKNRRKPVYAVFYYDKITGHVYSELDQGTFTRELKDIKELLTSIDEQGEKKQLLQLIDVLTKKSQKTKEHEFWEQYLIERDMPTEIQKKTLINSVGFFRPTTTTNNFFEVVLSTTETIQPEGSLFIFQDDHGLEAIPNVLLKLISDATFTAEFTNQQKMLCLECLNNNYQTLFDSMFEEVKGNQQEEFIHKKQSEIYDILRTTINNNSLTEDPVLLAKAKLIITCMKHNIKVVAIDVSTDTKRQLDKTHPYDAESDFADQTKETRINIGDKGMVYFIQQYVKENEIAIALVGGQHAPGIKGQLSAEMRTMNISVLLRGDDPNVWKIGIEEFIPPLETQRDETIDMTIIVSEQYRFSGSPIELRQLMEEIPENISLNAADDECSSRRTSPKINN